MSVMQQFHMKAPQVWLEKLGDFAERSGYSKPEVVRNAVLEYMQTHKHLVEPVHGATEASTE